MSAAVPAAVAAVMTVKNAAVSRPFQVKLNDHQHVSRYEVKAQYTVQCDETPSAIKKVFDDALKKYPQAHIEVRRCFGDGFATVFLRTELEKICDTY